MNHPLYQIFSVSVGWTQDGVDSRCHHHFKEMPKLNTSLSDMEEWVRWNWWPKYQPLAKLRIDNPTDITIDVRYVESEAWCLCWFSHWTWDIGLSDIEVRMSFHRFVFRRIDENRRLGREDGSGLMGADESYRWTGKRNQNGTPTPAPCTCQQCHDLGIKRIDH